MADPAAAVIVAVYAVTFLGLAGLLILTSFANRAARIFAMLLVLRGLANMSAYASAVDPDDAALYEGLYGYLAIPLASAALYFAAVYPRPRAWCRSAAVRAGVFLAPVLAFVVWYGLDHAAFAGGPLAAVPNAWLPAYAVVAWVLMRDLAGERSDTGRRSVALVALGFAVVSAFDVGTSVAVTTLDPAGAADAWALVALAAAAAVATAAVGVEAWRQERPGMVWTLIAFAVAGFVSMLVAAAVPGAAILGDVALTASRVVLPVVVTYGLLRTRVFGLDLSVRWTVSRGTIAASFLAAFFVAAQLAESFLQTRYDWVAGSVAAGLLLFALAPLQRAAERVAERAVPNTKPVASMSDAERDAFYRDLLKAAWADGNLSREERRVLETARERLGIPPERAHALEGEAAG